MLKQLIVLSILMASTSCASTKTPNWGDFELVDRFEEYCVFAQRGARNSIRYLTTGKECSLKLAGIQEAVKIEGDVVLSAKELKLAISVLRAHSTQMCEKFKDLPFALCLKDDMPNFVSANNGRFVFWYGRAVNPGDGGIPITLVRSGTSFYVLR